jgi:RNA polymerase sigma factor (TIGR02999 family)
MDSNQNSLSSFESLVADPSFVECADSEMADTGEWIKRTYRKLHKIAVSQMYFERDSHTLSATSLIHEVFLRLRTRDASTWLNERQFLAIVASEMRRVLIDAARRKKSVKKGGQFAQLTLDRADVVESLATSQSLADSIVELNDAVDEFEKIEPERAELVRLRYFLGLTEVEAAQTLGISRATASRYWTFARAWLLDFLSD